VGIDEGINKCEGRKSRKLRRGGVERWGGGRGSACSSPLVALALLHRQCFFLAAADSAGVAGSASSSLSSLILEAALPVLLGIARAGGRRAMQLAA
jgi:hypothetical protein